LLKAQRGQSFWLIFEGPRL